jgi:hypothetical protein
MHRKEAPQVAAPASIQDDANFCRPFLFKLVAKKRFIVACAGLPVDPAKRIACLVISHAIEVDSSTGPARRDRSRVDPCLARPDCNAF